MKKILIQFSIHSFSIIKGMLKKVDCRFMILPLLVAIVIGTLIYLDIYPLTPQDSEKLALFSLSTFAGICLIRFFITRHMFFLWATALLSVLLCREIHFKGTTAGVYIGLIILLILLLLYYDKLCEFLNNPTILTFLTVGFVFYFLSYTLDQRWWKVIIPGEHVFHTSLEESMELFGHCIIGLTLILSKKV